MTTFTGRRGLLLLGLGALAVLAGCGNDWNTHYEPLSASAKDWHIRDIEVVVPGSLTISEDNSTYVPKADIVWQGEPPGDRRAQVASILKEGLSKGAVGLRPRQPVRLRVTLRTFHALNTKSRYSAPEGTGVYDIRYAVEVLDARTGAVILPAQEIAADFPALTGKTAIAAEARGETQRRVIVDHLAATTAGWLGIGPDNRTKFRRTGG